MRIEIAMNKNLNDRTWILQQILKRHEDIIKPTKTNSTSSVVTQQTVADEINNSQMFHFDKCKL